MPTKDYDPIGEIIEAISAKHLWPVTKITTNTDGNITIGPGSIHDYDTATFSGTFAMEPIKTQISVKNGEYIKVGKEPLNPFAIRSVLSNRRKNAFTVVWEDGTTTVVHCQEGDEWDDEKALAMCFTKKALGNKGNFNDKFNDALDNKMKVIPAEATGGTIKMSDSTISFTRPITLGTEAVKKMTEASEKTLRSPINGQLVIDNIDKVEVESKFDTISNTVKEVGKTADEASRKVDEMAKKIAELSKDEKTYEVYRYNLFTDEKELVFNGTLDAIHSYIKSYASKHVRGFLLFRTWNKDGGMYMDYGSYSHYFFIPGITNSEYGNN